jgi:DNA polymerase-1
VSAHQSDPALRAPGPLLLVLDGNSLTHRAYHAAALGRLADETGRPVWAVKGLIGYIARAAARLRPDAVLVGFDCPDESVRKVEFAGYKAQRPPKPADLVSQLLDAPAILRAAGLTTVVVTAHEADDVLASGAALARREGWRAVVMTSDRDAFALIDETTSVLRVRNGGFDEAVLVTPESLIDVYGVHPSQYRDYAALRGDPSDNLPGVRGFGSAMAARLLAAFGTLDAALEGDGAKVRSLVGEAAANHLTTPESREIVARNRSLMRLRDHLPMPALDSARVPVDRMTMRRAFAERGIYLGPSLWALTGAPPPPSEAELIRVPQPWVWRRSPRANRAPAPGQLALF